MYIPCIVDICRHDLMEPQQIDDLKRALEEERRRAEVNIYFIINTNRKKCILQIEQDIWGHVK